MKFQCTYIIITATYLNQACKLAWTFSKQYLQSNMSVCVHISRGVATIEAVEAAASVNLLTSDLLEIDSS